MSGLKLLTHIRQTPRLKHQKFLMITAEIDKELLMKAKNLGIDGYILKPFKLEVLEAKLKLLFKLT